MSFGLSHGKPLDDAPGVVGVGAIELPPMPDDIVSNPEGARVDPRGWFAHPERRFELEIGSGKGTFLVQQAALAPETNYLGIEWAREFYLYAADRVRRRREAGGAGENLSNVRLLNTDATQLLKWRVPGGIASVIHLYFSDPWPKARHHKKRVVQHWSMGEFFRVLEPGGELRVVTDHDELWAWMDGHFRAWTEPGVLGRIDTTMEGMVSEGLSKAAREALGALGPDRAPFERIDFDRPESAGEGELVGTNFERKFREQGRSFNAVVLRRT